MSGIPGEALDLLLQASILFAAMLVAWMVALHAGPVLCVALLILHATGTELPPGVVWVFVVTAVAWALKAPALLAAAWRRPVTPPRQARPAGRQWEDPRSWRRRRDWRAADPARARSSAFRPAPSARGSGHAPPPRPDPPREARPPASPRRSAPHVVLGIAADASPDVVRKAYRELIKRHHPDRVLDASEERRRHAHERTMEIRSAYEELHPRRRASPDTSR